MDKSNWMHDKPSPEFLAWRQDFSNWPAENSPEYQEARKRVGAPPWTIFGKVRLYGELSMWAVLLAYFAYMAWS